MEDRLGRDKAHFTVTPLAFIPLGALKSVEFFNVEEEISEAIFLPNISFLEDHTEGDT